MGIYENFEMIMKYNRQEYLENMYVSSREIRDRKRFGMCESPIKKMLQFESPVMAWLNELQSLTEVESLSALQAKSVATTPESFEALSIRNAQITIQQIRHNSSNIMENLDVLIDSLPVECHDLCVLLENFHEIHKQIGSLIEICKRKGCDYIIKKELSTEVIAICEQTIYFMQSFVGRKMVNNAQIEANARKLKEMFGELIDVTIRKECTILITSLNKKTSRLGLKWSLLALWQLTRKDPYICRLLIANPNTIRYLLDVVQNYNKILFNEIHQIKTAALRVLTYLCSNREAIKQILDEIAKNKFFMTLVCNETEDSVLRETVGLLVQITTPFIDSRDVSVLNENVKVWTNRNKPLINELVNFLTETLKNTSNDKIFLMACAALANISFMSCDPLVKFETLNTLLNILKQKTQYQDKLLLKDQIITLLANTSQKYPLEVVSSGGLIFLLNTLINERTSFDQNYQSDKNQTHSSVLAIERIQQKIAVALARLGIHKSSAKIIHRLNGLARLVQIVKEPMERNYSDTVLLASIAALKRISESIGKMPFKELNATDLIESKLQDIFFNYSIKNESLV